MEKQDCHAAAAASGAPKLGGVPASWFHLCASRRLDRGPIAQKLGGKSYVGYRTKSGRVAVLDGRCPHMGASLGCGGIHGERLVCPLHGWEFGTDGLCAKIPSSDAIPGFARLTRFPVEERGGHVFFFNRREARFPLPFFDGVQPEELRPASPFELEVDTPWYLVGANGFDIQHFRMAHDRTLLDEPQVIPLPPFGRRVIARLAVTGESVQDRLTRLFAGPTVTMEVTSWCGTIVTVEAQFARTTSYGLVNILPIDEHRTLSRIIVWVRRSGNPVGRLLFDPLNAAVRRASIRRFLQADLPRIDGLRYRPERLIASDGVLSDYLGWLKNIAETTTADPS